MAHACPLSLDNGRLWFLVYKVFHESHLLRAPSLASSVSELRLSARGFLPPSCSCSITSLQGCPCHPYVTRREFRVCVPLHAYLLHEGFPSPGDIHTLSPEMEQSRHSKDSKPCLRVESGNVLLGESTLNHSELTGSKASRVRADPVPCGRLRGCGHPGDIGRAPVEVRVACSGRASSADADLCGKAGSAAGLLRQRFGRRGETDCGHWEG